MGWFLSLVIISALVSFIMYNLDQINKIGADIRYVKNQLESIADLHTKIKENPSQ